MSVRSVQNESVPVVVCVFFGKSGYNFLAMHFRETSLLLFCEQRQQRLHTGGGSNE